MKRVEAIFKPSKLPAVRDALDQIGVAEIVVEQHRPKVKIAVVVANGLTQQVVRTIESAARA